jgi:hypothetical protein
MKRHENKEEVLSMRKLPDTHSDNSVEPDRPSTPRWVKVSGIVAIILVLLAVIMMFIGGGKHGPGRHIPSIEQGVQQP